MADLKASAAGILSLADAGLLLASIGGVDGVVSGEKLRDYLGNTRTVQNAAAQAVGANTTAYLTGSDFVIPAAGLRQNTRFYWHVPISKTAAGTAAMSVLVKYGALGTTADATVLTMSLGAQTAVADAGAIEVVVMVRTLGAAGVLQGLATMYHNLQITGLAVLPSPTVHATSAAVDLTASAGKRLGLALVSGASHSFTIPMLEGDARNL